MNDALKFEPPDYDERQFDKRTPLKISVREIGGRLHVKSLKYRQATVAFEDWRGRSH